MSAFRRRIVLLLVLVGTGAGGAHAAPRVFVGVAPLQSMVSEIAGAEIEVRVLLPEGASPATYEPQARQLRRLAEAKVLFVVGLPFEEVLVGRLDLGAGEAECVSLAPPPSAGRGPDDPHRWLDPLALAEMGRICGEWFAAANPDSAAAYRRRVASYEVRARAFDAALRSRVAALSGRSFVSVHPAYSAFARRYGLRQIALEVEGRVPTGRGLARVIEEVRASGTRLVLVQPQHSSRPARILAAELGMEMREIDPLDPDPWRSMTELITALEESAEGGGLR